MNISLLGMDTFIELKSYCGKKHRDTRWRRVYFAFARAYVLHILLETRYIYLSLSLSLSLSFDKHSKLLFVCSIPVKKRVKVAVRFQRAI